MRSAMKPEPTRLTMPKPSISDSICGTARHAVAQVAAIGDDVHLWHRHGDAAASPATRQQRLQYGGAQTQRAEARRRRLVLRPARHRCRRAQQQSQRHHRDDAEHADAEMRGTPADAAIERSTTGGQSVPAT